ncbi:hypothetical protein [Spartinivicinus ruber]|uniref:hypothetical protein n=1 Tax=Spartinivicinus ruber TaxID=2683272 RepID=UPI0013D44B1A|nr:hypothetical protein [Spartinivicinus ruber]
MIPVKNATHRSSSANLRGFRDIKNSTYSKRLFTGLGGNKKLTVRMIKPELDGFNIGDFKLKGGSLETRWFGHGLDNVATEVFAKLQDGGLLMGFVGNLLSSAYRPMRFSIINKLITLFYQIVIQVLTVIHNFIWRVLLIPLMIIALVLTIVLLFDFAPIVEFASQTVSVVISFFGNMLSSLAK